MSTKPNPERVTHRTLRVAQILSIVLFGSLLAHAWELPDYAPTGFFNVHLGATFFVGLLAAIVGCTRHLLRAQRKTREKLTFELKKHDKRILTPADVRQLLQDAFDEGQITGLATGLKDLSRSPRAKSSEN